MKRILKQFPFIRNFLIGVRHKFWTIRTINNLKIYLDKHTVRKLQLGAGTNGLADWFNTDYFPRETVFFIDVTKPFPVPSVSFNFVFTEHHIEHISYKNAVFMLKESFRVLKPGGLIRITTPDLKTAMTAYLNGPGEEEISDHSHDYIYSGFYNAINYIPVDDYVKAHEFNDMFYNYEHKFIYDFESLKRILEHAGFVNVTNRSRQTTTHNEFSSIETHISDNDIYSSLAVEAEKSR